MSSVSLALNQVEAASKTDIARAGRSSDLSTLSQPVLLNIDAQFLPSERQDWPNAHNPLELSSGTTEAVVKQLHGQVLDPPPVFVKDKEAAQSTMAAKMKRWLESEEGRWWQQGRSALFGTKQDGENIDDHE